MDRSSFAHLLRFYRRSAMLTQEQLAERAKVSTRAISDLERGIYKSPRKYTLSALSDALQLNAEQRYAFEAAARVEPDFVSTKLPPTLPIPLVPLIGRECETQMVERLLTIEKRRLVTLTGPGGVGKTRIAIEIARNLSSNFDRTLFIDLSTIAQPTLVPFTIAGCLGLNEIGSDLPLGALIKELNRTRSLLVLDNFEHLLDASVFVSRLLASCAELHVLTTSRSRLRIRGEREIEIAPFQVPSRSARYDLTNVSKLPAIQLFVERAQGVDPEFEISSRTAPLLIEICRRLDGLPLAIELAAPKIKLLPLDMLLKHLEHPLPVLIDGDRDLPIRHRALTATINWSHNLLTSEEQMLFRRLAAFSGGASLEAIERVCLNGNARNAFELVAALVEKSLIRRAQRAGIPRFAMLETIREFASELLKASNEYGVCRIRHAEYFVELVERAEPELLHKSQIEWIELLEIEIDNLRSALNWASETQHWETGLRLAAALAQFWDLRGHLSEGCYWLGVMLSGQGEPISRARALNVAGSLARKQGDTSVAYAYLTEAFEIHRTLRNTRGAARALINLGALAHDQGEFAKANELLQQSESYWNEVDDLWGRAAALNHMGAVEHAQYHIDRAESLLQQSLRIRREIGDIRGTAESNGNLANIARDRRDLPHAAHLYLECLRLSHKVGDQAGIASGLDGLAHVAALYEKRGLAARLSGAADRLREASGMPARGSEAKLREELRDDLRRALGDERFQSELNHGRDMSIDSAICEGQALPTASS